MRGALGIPDLVGASLVGDGEANMAPEGSGEGAVKYHIIGGFRAHFAQVADILVDDRLAEEVGLTLNSSMDEQPGKELHLGRCSVVPEKIKEVARSVLCCG